MHDKAFNAVFYFENKMKRKRHTAFCICTIWRNNFDNIKRIARSVHRIDNIKSYLHHKGRKWKMHSWVKDRDIFFLLQSSLSEVLLVTRVCALCINNTYVAFSLFSVLLLITENYNFRSWSKKRFSLYRTFWVRSTEQFVDGGTLWLCSSFRFYFFNTPNINLMTRTRSKVHISSLADHRWSSE